MIAEKIFVKTARIENARIEKLEMIDKATGEIYCTWIENGEWQKAKGECGQLKPNPDPTPPALVCTPNWSCADWQPLPETIACGKAFTQTRTCTDSNNCGIDEGKPIEQQEAVRTQDCPTSE